MSVDALQALAVLGGSITAMTFLGIGLSNILYSRPRVDKLTSENREYGQKIAALEAQNKEQGIQIRTLQLAPMEALKEVAGAVSLMAKNMTAEVRAMREAGAEEHAALITAIKELGDARSGR